jgi:glycosyltransferase involved in cell wall biosynthesis
MALGSTTEVIAHGKTGFLCNNVDEFVEAIDQVAQLNRNDCRDHVSKHFSVQKMTAGYEAVYQQVLAKRFSQNGHIKSASRVSVN